LSGTEALPRGEHWVVPHDQVCLYECAVEAGEAFEARVLVE
jgi:hypothetical protein